MKIIFFIDSFPAGGKERRLLELMKGLKDKPGVEFELVIMSNDVHYKEIFDLGIKVHFVIRKTKKDFSVFSQFYKICKNGKADIAHCWDSMSAVYLVPVTKLLGIKLVNGMVVDTPIVQNYKNKNWLRAKLTFPFSHLILGNSKAGLQGYGAKPAKSICIYNGFNFSRTENLTDKDIILKELKITTSYIIGMVASFSKFKDYPTYYKAAELILSNRKDVTFLAIGDFTDSEASRQLIPEVLLPNFRLLGRRSGIESYVNCFDIGVLATFTEGISNSILEYMALARPVIATDGGGTKEIVEDNETGFLVAQSNVSEMADKMNILLADSVLRNKMGLAGQEKVRKQFQLSNMVNECLIKYQQLVSK